MIEKGGIEVKSFCEVTLRKTTEEHHFICQFASEINEKGQILRSTVTAKQKKYAKLFDQTVSNVFHFLL